jgi:hypothetical protein
MADTSFKEHHEKSIVSQFYKLIMNWNRLVDLIRKSQKEKKFEQFRNIVKILF